MDPVDQLKFDTLVGLVDTLVARIADLEFAVGLEFPDPHQEDEIMMRKSAAAEARIRFEQENKHD